MSICVAANELQQSDSLSEYFCPCKLNETEFVKHLLNILEGNKIMFY